MRLCIMILCQPFSKSKLLWLLTRFDISRPDLTFRDKNCWFYSNPESTVWMVCVFSRMAIPILTTRINKVGPRINKGGPRINKGGPRINKVGKPETINWVARLYWPVYTRNWHQTSVQVCAKHKTMYTVKINPGKIETNKAMKTKNRRLDAEKTIFVNLSHV